MGSKTRVGMNTITKQLDVKYGITAIAGQKVKCPFCEHYTFSITPDDSLGKCFHPSCEKYLTDHTKGGNIKSKLSLLLEEIYKDFHNELLTLKGTSLRNAYEYVVKKRRVHPQVVVDFKLGAVPSNYNIKDKFKPLFVELKNAHDNSKGNASNKKKSKKKSEPDNSDLKQLTTWFEKMEKLTKGCTGWLCFFYTDSFGLPVAIRLRKPYIKKIFYFKPFKETAGVFGCLDTHSSEDESSMIPRRLIVTEGEINQLQLQSLVLRYRKSTRKEKHYLRVCSVGGVTNADYKTIKEIDPTPIICYDNDKNGAGFALVEKARKSMSISAFTTPTIESDLDSYIRTFNDDHQKAWDSFTELLSQRKVYPRYYSGVAAEIDEIRRNKDEDGHRLYETFEVNRMVADVIIEDLYERGKFYNDGYEAYFFMDVEKNLLRIHQDYLDFRLLMSWFGLNATEAIYNFVVDTLQIEAFDKGSRTEVYRFSFCDPQTFALYLFNNNNQIYKITADSVLLADNGTDGILFLKDANADPFTIRKPTANYSGFDQYIISRINFASEILRIDEKKIILTLWFYSLFFENIMKTKPILTFIGPKKSGKTSALAKIGALLLGDGFNVTPLSDDEKDFDAAITNQHLVVIDNADSAIKWFNNRLATSATGGTLKKRELYTTNKLVEFPIRSYIAITARTPKFRRDDVAERLLILKLDTIRGDVIPENILREEISQNRDNILSEVVCHLQEIVAALKDNSEHINVGSFRMADFADFMLKIARYANIENFVKRILRKLTTEQSHFTLEDDITVELLLEWVKVNEKREVTSSELHHELSEMATEKQIDFFYKDKSRGFAYHLKNIVSNLSDFLDIEENIVGGRKHLYRFSQKEDGENYV